MAERRKPTGKPSARATRNQAGGPQRQRPAPAGSKADPVRAQAAAKKTNRTPPPKKTAPSAAAQPAETAGATESRVLLSLPIVGIGASAGGLEALELFLKNVPPDSGMAFVVVQHLDPNRKGVMAELLQRATPLPVIEVKDPTKVEADRVYLIPPNKDMSIRHGVLHLLAPASSKGLRLPIDFFFRSLAEDQQDHGIGVVLSGMGSDGTLGLRAIKEKAGAAFVQSLTSAKFDGMPRSAIEAGVADVVAPVEQIPPKILAYTKHAPSLGRATLPLEDKAQSALDKIFVLLHSQTGSDFSAYKKSTVYRRIERRMGLHQIDKIANYAAYLRDNVQETEQLFKELLIGVTSFFRDPAAWDHLAGEVLPQLLSERGAGTALRAWVPGCSTGEEAYSLAIVFREAMDHLKPPKPLTLQVFATDLDKEAIERARFGVYPANIAADVSPQRLHRFFLQDERGFRVAKDIREMVIFAPQNLIMDPPFTKLDILCCRNLLIYLAPEVQKRLIPLFHYSLNPGGILFLGSAETVGSFANLFTPMNPKTRIYRRQAAPAGAIPVEFPSLFSVPPTTGQAQPAAAAPTGAAGNLQALAERILVQRFSPAAVLTNEKGDILYFSGRTGKYLEPAAGRANLNLFAMAREGLRYELSNAFTTAVREDRAVTVNGVGVRTNGGIQLVHLTVERLTQPDTLRGTVMVVFNDALPKEEAASTHGKAAAHPAGDPRLNELEEQLQHALEDSQSVREEMQTSQEELKSTNEELQSTNEELQSTNEELTTSKEEMQSLNEELQTVNHELQAKVDELSRSNNDMKNLLNSTDIATLFLDDQLNVRRFTTETTKIIKLIPGDAGRPITDMANDLNYPELADDAHQVLRTLIFHERIVSSRNGDWYSVRILPYRTLDNVIDGVVITFSDVTKAKTLEAALSDQAAQSRQMAESLPGLVWGATADGAWDYVNHQWTEYTGLPGRDHVGDGWLNQVEAGDRSRIKQAWKSAVHSGSPLDVDVRIRSKGGEPRWFRFRAVPVHNAGKITRWYGSATDVEDLKRE